jgi:uncharacterized protein YbjT (DUF2867 family)
LFSVTTAPIDIKGAAIMEERQGKAMTKAAIEAGVQHIVYTSVDRGVKSDVTETDIPHFRSKKHVEDDIRVKAAEKGVSSTFIRPVAFMETSRPIPLAKASWQCGARSVHTRSYSWCRRKTLVR